MRASEIFIASRPWRGPISAKTFGLVHILDQSQRNRDIYVFYLRLKAIGNARNHIKAIRNIANYLNAIRNIANYLNAIRNIANYLNAIRNTVNRDSHKPVANHD